ncbi:hypothetical protein M0813_27330 [Anaeramoeba flamelloides]|uniref:Uncharacterized protein n=1 Tax=Anaeramoeba flamelloides TaxID=1746091 RepID=A0ABQ8XVE5_9EUKA|nr:hypothetical protein M0813_27330 [Anaeramoeba flamelloides]
MLKICGCILYDKKTKTIKGLHTPYILDLVTDNVRSRTDEVSEILFETYPLTLIYYHQTHVKARIRIINEYQVGLSNKTVQIKPIVQLDTEDLLDGGLTLSQSRNSHLSDIGTEGNLKEKTDSDGFVSFDFVLTYGPVGLVLFEFTCDEQIVYFPVLTVSKVNKIKLLNEPSQSVQEFGKALTIQPRVQILDEDDNPLSGHYVSLFILYAQFLSNGYIERGAELKHHTQGPSDSDGIIQFKNFAVTGSNTDQQFFGIFCEDNIDDVKNIKFWVNYKGNFTDNMLMIQPINFETEIQEIKIIKDVSVINTDGEAFKTQPKLQVLDSEGKGIAGKYIYAKLSVQNGHTASDYREDLSWFTKYLLNPIIGPTDSNGFAEYDDLRLSVKGHTGGDQDPDVYFEIKFRSEGVISEPTNKFYISSQVASLKWIHKPTKITPLLNNAYADDQDLSDPYGSIYPRPMLRVLDSKGFGIADKLVILQAYPDDFKDDLSLIQLENNFAWSDSDGVVSFSETRIISYQSSTYQNVTLVIKCDTIDDFIVDPIEIEIGTNDALRCSRILFEESDIPKEDGKYVVGNAPTDLTITIVDYKGDPMPGMDGYLGIDSTNSINNLPDVINMPSQIDTTSDANGQITIKKFRLFGLNTTVNFYFAARNSNLSSMLDMEYDCMYSFSITITNAVREIQIAEFPDTESDIFFPSDPINNKIKLRAVDYLGNGIEDVAIFVIISQFPKYAYQFEAYDIMGPNNQTIEPPDTLPILSDIFFNIEKTDADGYVYIQDLNMAISGDYNLIFLGNGIISESSDILNVKTKVDKILINVQPNNTNNEIVSGVRFGTQPEVVILDENDQPLQNYYVGALIKGHEEEMPLSSEYHQVMAVSHRSDADGTAVFSELTLKQITDKDYYQISFRAYSGDSSMENDWIEAISDPILGIPEVFQIIVSGFPSSSAPGVSFPSIPIVQVADGNSDGLGNKIVSVKVITGPEDNTDIDQIFENYEGLTGDNGAILFLDLMFASSAPLGHYTVQFISDGFTSENHFIECTTQVDTLNIIMQPNSEIKTGIPFPVRSEVVIVGSKIIVGRMSVQALTKSGGVIPNKVVTAFIKQNVDNTGILDSKRILSSTDDNGIAEFDLKFVAGTPGEYTLQFSADGIFTDETDVITLSNPIKRIEIIKQPGIKDEKNVEINEVLPQQPIIKIIKHDDEQIDVVQYKTVTITANNGGRVKYSTTYSDTNGEIELKDISIIDCPSGSYQLFFNVDGIISPLSDEIQVYNPSEPNFSSISNLKNYIVIGCLVVILPFLANSAYHRKKLLMLLPFASIVFVLTLAIESLNQIKGPFTNFYIGFSFILFLISSFFTIIGILIIIILHLSKKNNNWEFHKKKSNNFLDLVNRLIRIGSNRSLIRNQIIEKILNYERSKIHLLNNSEFNKKEEDTGDDEYDHSNNEIETENEKEKEECNDRKKKKKKKVDSLTFIMKKWEDKIDLLTDEQLEIFLENSNQFIEKFRLKKYIDVNMGVDNNKENGIDKASDKRNDIELANIEQINNSNDDDDDDDDDDNDDDDEYDHSNNDEIGTGNGNRKKRVSNYFKKQFNKLQKAYLNNNNKINYHKPFELKGDFYYPQRILISIFLSVVIVIFCILLYFKLSVYLEDNILIKRQELFTYRTKLSSYISYYDVMSQISTTEFSESLNKLQSFIDKNVQTVKTPEIELTATLKLVNFLTDIKHEDITSFFDVLTVCIIFADIIGVAVLVYLWYSILKEYRKNIMLLRQGIYPFKSRTNISDAGNYTNLQTWLSGIAFVVVSFFSCLLFICFAYNHLREFLWYNFWPLLLLIFLSYLIKKIVQELSSRYLIENNQIKHFRIFVYKDFFWNFLNIIISFSLSIVRILFKLCLSLITIIRVDVPIVSGFLSVIDAGYLSYVGLAMMDHDHNNPTHLYFSNLMKMIFKKKRHEEKVYNFGKKNEKKYLKTIKVNKVSQEKLLKYKKKSYQDPQNLKLLLKKRLNAKWFLLSTLANNPNLKKYRGEYIEKRNTIKREKEELKMLLTEKEKKIHVEIISEEEF